MVEFSQTPFPYETGIVGYPAADTAAKFGAPGEVDDQGVIRRISVTPGPYQRPHPPVFVASASSMASIQYCGANGFVVAHFSSLDKTVEFAQGYQEAAEAAGTRCRSGRTRLRFDGPTSSSTRSDYDRKLREYDTDIFENFYAKFFKEKLPVEADILKAVKDSGLFLGGTVDQAKAAYVAEWERLPSEYAILIWHWARQPTDDVIHEMELMATEVFPEIGGLAPPEERPRAQWALERSNEPTGVR